MGVIVTFDYATWLETFPQFSNVTETQVKLFVLPVASQYCRNDGGGPVNDAGIQAVLLNLMVAHVAQLIYGSTTQPLSPLVGRISAATQGSVNVAMEYPLGNPDDAWFVQTTYGAMFLAMSMPYRQMRYISHRYPQARPGPAGSAEFGITRWR